MSRKVSLQAARANCCVPARSHSSPGLGVAYQGAFAATAQTHTVKGSFTWDF
jgi:hypothetical protein